MLVLWVALVGRRIPATVFPVSTSEEGLVSIVV